MTGRDRIVLISAVTLVVLAAVWLLAISPEREQASKLSTEVSAAQTQLSSAEGQVTSARQAQSQYTTAYASIVSLGKAVPPGQEVPSLIYQLDQASNQKHVEFSSITSGSGASTAAAAAATGFTEMPFTFVFNGGYEDLYHLFQQLNGFTVRTASGGLEVSGRLLTIQSVKLSPVTSSGAEKSAEKSDGHDHRDRLRAAREPGADRRGDGKLSRGRGDARVLDLRSRELPDGSRDREGEPMSEFVNSLKADLLDRRLLPILALVGVALVAAVAYAVLGGGGSTATTPAATSTTPVAKGVSGIAVSQAPTNPNQAVAEITSGASHQRGGASRDPFTPLPGTKSTTSTTSASAKSTAPTTSGSGSSSRGSGGTTPAPAKPSPAKPSPQSSTTSPCCSAWLPPARHRRARS